MGAVGKHFPGHGFALDADTHHDVARDDRPLSEILRKDIAPYRAAIQAGLAGVMPAHVIYSAVRCRARGYSKYWLQEVLRGKLGFDGLIFSDDLSMAGASAIGGPPERARRAGCRLRHGPAVQQPEAAEAAAGVARGPAAELLSGSTGCDGRRDYERASPIAKPRNADGCLN